MSEECLRKYLERLLLDCELGFQRGVAFHRAVRPGSTGAMLASLPPPQLPLSGEIYLWEVTLDGAEQEELELVFDQTFGESMKIVEKGINSEFLSTVPWKAIK